MKNAKKDLYEYYFNNSDLLTKYYNDDYSIKTPSNDHSILQFFTKNPKEKNEY